MARLQSAVVVFDTVSQAEPPLSRAIRQLEHQLGVQLFTRDTHQVSLTPAGEALLDDARTALDAVSAAARRAQHAAETTSKLRLALKADIDGGLLPRILDEFARDEAALPVELVLGRVGEQAQTVRDGRADAALLLNPFNQRGLDSEQLITEPFLLAMASDDPLAARVALRLADLKGWALPDGPPPIWAAPSSTETPRRTHRRTSPTCRRSSSWSSSAASSASSPRRSPRAIRDPRSPTAASRTSNRPPCPWPGPETPAPRPSPPSSARP